MFTCNGRHNVSEQLQPNCSTGISLPRSIAIDWSFSQNKHGDAFKTQTLMKILEVYKWPCTDGEEIMQNKLSYDNLYTTLSASILILENEMKRKASLLNELSDSRIKLVTSPTFTAFGERCANVSATRMTTQNHAFRNHQIHNKQVFSNPSLRPASARS